MILAFISSLIACDNDESYFDQAGISQSELATPTVMKSMASNDAFGWTYFPNHNLSYSTSSLGETKPGYGGSYLGGFFKANLIENDGKYYVRLTPAVGTYLPVGKAYVKVGSLYGGFGTNSANIYSKRTYVDVPVSIGLNNNNDRMLGVLNLWPCIITTVDDQTTRLFSYPILIWTKRFYNNEIRPNKVRGQVDGVSVKNVSKGCVKFCQTYYSAIYKKNLSNMGNAKMWPEKAADFGLTYYPNGMAEPQVGDIVCWSGGSNDLGHVAIIFEVQGDRVKIAHQGHGNSAPIGVEIKKTGSRLNNPFSSHTLKGLIRRNN